MKPPNRFDVSIFARAIATPLTGPDPVPPSSAHIIACVPDDFGLWAGFFCAGVGETGESHLRFMSYS